MLIAYFMRVPDAELAAWTSLGWEPVGGHESPSVGLVHLVEWRGDGEPTRPSRSERSSDTHDGQLFPVASARRLGVGC